MESENTPPVKKRSSFWGKISLGKVAPLMNRSASFRAKTARLRVAAKGGPKSFDQLTAHLRAMQEGGDHYGKTNCGVMVSYDRADEPSVRWLHAEFMKRYE